MVGSGLFELLCRAGVIYGVYVRFEERTLTNLVANRCGGWRLTLVRVPVPFWVVL